MALSIRSQAANYEGALPAIAANPAAVEAGDTVVVAWLVEADAAVTALEPGTVTISGSTESQPLTAHSAGLIEDVGGGIKYSYAIGTITIDADLAAQIVSEAGYSFGGAGYTFTGPGTIYDSWSFCWWVDPDGGTPDIAIGAYDANVIASLQTAGDSVAGTADSGGVVLFAAAGHGFTADGTISALTFAWSGVDASSSLSRGVDGGAWDAARAAYAISAGPAETGTLAGDTVDFPDDDFTLLLVASIVFNAAVGDNPAQANTDFFFPYERLAVTAKELPFYIDTGLLKGVFDE